MKWLKPRRQHSYLPPIITLAVAGFLGLIVVFALDEYWDLPARSFGAVLKPIRPYEFSIKVVAVLVDSADEVIADAGELRIEVESVVDAANTYAAFLWGPDRVRIEYVEHKPTFSLT